MRRRVSANVQEALVRSYVSFKRWIVHILAVRDGGRCRMRLRPRPHEIAGLDGDPTP